VNTSVLEGGLASWKGELKTGRLAPKIEYVKRLKPGEIAIEEFRKIADNRPEGTLIVDVRDAGAYADGHIPGAINVPLGDIPGRAARLKAAKKAIVTYCS